MLQSSNNALGENYISAFTAAMRIKMFCMCPLDSLGMAMATYCGQNFGAGHPHRIWAGIKDASKLMLLYSAFMAVVLWSGAHIFARLFISSH